MNTGTFSWDGVTTFLHGYGLAKGVEALFEALWLSSATKTDELAVKLAIELVFANSSFA